MKAKVLIAALLLGLTSQAYGQPMYIIDKVRINLRTGAGNDYRILRVLPSGTRVDVIEPGEKWHRVVTKDGEEGWLPSQWLSETPTSAIRLARLEGEHDALRSTADNLKDQVTNLTAQQKQLSDALSQAQKEAQEAKAAYTQLKEKSGNFLQLEEDYKETRNQLDNLAKKSDILNDRLAKKNMIWFLAGAGVLLVGYLMGSSSRKKRGSYY